MDLRYCRETNLGGGTRGNHWGDREILLRRRKI